MKALLVAGLLLAADAPFFEPPTEFSIPTPECSKETPCNALVFQLELNGVPVTMGDFTEEECEALRNAVMPGVILANPDAKLICVGYDVKREVS